MTPQGERRNGEPKGRQSGVPSGGAPKWRPRERRQNGVARGAPKWRFQRGGAKMASTGRGGANMASQGAHQNDALGRGGAKMARTRGRQNGVFRGRGEPKWRPQEVPQNGAYSGAPFLRPRGGAKMTSPGRASQWHTKGGGRLVSLGGHQNDVSRGGAKMASLARGCVRIAYPGEAPK